VKQNDYRSRALYVLIALASISYALPGYAESTADYLLFPHVGAIFRSGLVDDSLLDDEDTKYGIALFGTAEYGKLLFLGEFLLSKDEQEIERFQVGWTAGDSKIWLGRFHNPIGYWNSQFHHGSYLESSISRPSIVEFEDDNGLLPVHLTGLLIEGVKEHNKQGLGYALAVAIGPELSDNLEPLDVLEPASGSQDLSLTLNLYHEPVIYSPTRYGLFINYTEIPAASRGFEEIRQINAGAYGNWEAHPWRLVAATFYVENRLQQLNGTSTDSFFSGYIQAEHNLDDRWTVFGRGEWSLSDENDRYLALFPHHVTDRFLGGIRLDAFDRHAIKLEVSRNRTQADKYGQIVLQWDAMF